MAIMHIASTPDTVRWGTLPLPGDRPVATVESDDILRIDTVSHEGLLEDQGRDPLAFFHAQGVRDEDVLADAIDIAGRVEHPQGAGPHVITRSIAVKDVHPGDWLAIDVLSLKPRVPYGVISNRDGKGVLMGGLPRGGRAVSIFARAMEYQGRLQGVMRRSGPDAIETFRSGRTLRLPDPADGDIVFPLAPFLGIIGVTPDSGEHLSTVPPGDFGGNIDINLLVEGTRLYLPVFTEGAGLYVGDPHFAQGNGEVALTAFEASLDATLRVRVVARDRFVRNFGPLHGPLVETDDYLVPTGRALRLDDALADCTQEAIRLLGACAGFDEKHAYAYLSAAVDFDISEAVNVQRGVHAKIRKRDIGR